MDEQGGRGYAGGLIESNRKERMAGAVSQARRRLAGVGVAVLRFALLKAVLVALLCIDDV
jgi:hypothetical protein